MTAAHVVAVLVTAWVLARGEAWLWRTVARVAAAAGLAVGHPSLPGSTCASAGRPARHRPAGPPSGPPPHPRGPPLLLSR